MIDATETRANPAFGVPDGSQVLIVCEDSSAERLKAAFQQMGIVSEITKSLMAGCDYARSGRFQLIVSTPLLSDGSWRCLLDIAKRYDLGFEVVLWARNLELAGWADALKDGAFDVLDAVGELPRAAEVAKRALWAAYLRGAGPYPSAASHRKAA